MTVATLLHWPPSPWLRARRWIAQFDNRLLVDNRSVAEHNAHVARKEFERARLDLEHYERELRRVDVASRENDRNVARDSLTLAARGAR